MADRFVDRVASRPNRFKVTPEKGEPYYVTLERADEPVTLGTPLNAASLNSLGAEVDAKQDSLFRGTFFGNLDMATEYGTYWCNLSQCSNGPAETGYGWLEVRKSAENSTSEMQRFTFYNNGETHTRTYVNSQWYAWFKVNSLSLPLSVANGGTGKTTGADAANSLINALSTSSSAPEDADYYVSQYAGGGTSTKTYHRRPMSALWSYIQSKISSVLGLTSSAYGGNAASATKLATARTVRTNLASTSTASFNGSANITPGVTGTLPIANGGTGATSAATAVQNLFSSGSSITSYPSKPGIYRTTGTKVCTNSQSTLSGYGVLVIFQATYGMHFYLDSNGTLIYGYSGDTFGQPSTWNRVTYT